MKILERFRTSDSGTVKQMQIELANSYRQIMGTMAFKHLMEEIEKEYQDSYKSEDQCDIKDLSVALAGEARGVRKGLAKIKKVIQNATGSALA